MAKVPVYMPKFGMTMMEAEIMDVYVEKGQAVSKGDALFSIETEKTNVDIEAPEDGFVCDLLVEEGDVAEVGNVLAHIAQTEAEIDDATEQEPQAPAVAKEPPAPQVDACKSQPMSKMRKIIADKMKSSLQNTAQLTHFREVCMEELVRYKGDKEGVSYNDIFVKAFALAAARYEKACNQLVNGQMEVCKPDDVGLAVALDDGLIVPAIRGAAKGSLQDIAKERKRVVAAARAGTLSAEDTAGCVGTVSNLGLQEIDGFTPILNTPESVILGVGRMIEKPWVKDGEIKILPITTFSLTFDHQVLDGLDAAEFLSTFCNIIQNPCEMDG